MNIDPIINKSSSRKHEITNKIIAVLLRRKKRQSTKPAANNTMIESESHIICLTNKTLKEFIVKIPAIDIKNMAPKSNQSIFLIKRTKDFIGYFYSGRHLFAYVG